MTEDEIKNAIDNNDVVIFMKGSKDFPACGFSAFVVQIFNQLNVPFKDFDVMQNPELRQNIKDFSNWPTLPQVYVKGEFIGGCDIIREMHQSEELQTLLKQYSLLPCEATVEKIFV